MDSRIVMGGALLGFLGLGMLERWADQRRRRWPRRPSYELEATDVDDVDEFEPVGIQYDQRMPCVFNAPQPMGPDEEGCILPADLEPVSQFGVPFARGVTAPAWPLRTSHSRNPQVSYVDVRDQWHGKWGREFGASRKSTGESGSPIYRRHAGVDLFAEEGDDVLAMEDGEVIAILPFHHGAWAIYVMNDTGDVINYGEVQNKSWWRHGIDTGSRVQRGEPIARIGKMYADTMLHVEAYDAGGDVEALVDQIRNERLRWTKNKPPPSSLLDPTHYLLAAQRTALT